VFQGPSTAPPPASRITGQNTAWNSNLVLEIDDMHTHTHTHARTHAASALPCASRLRVLPCASRPCSVRLFVPAPSLAQTTGTTITTTYTTTFGTTTTTTTTTRRHVSVFRFKPPPQHQHHHQHHQHHRQEACLSRLCCAAFLPQFCRFAVLFAPVVESPLVSRTPAAGPSKRGQAGRKARAAGKNLNGERHIGT
jgi:hypothetical protein